MHTEIRETDIQWLAEGSWDHYLRHNDLQGVAQYKLSAVIIVMTGLALLLVGIFSGSSTETVFTRAMLSTPVTAMLVMGLILTGVAFILGLKGSTNEHREKDKFVDWMIDQWESGIKDLPDDELVAEYLQKRGKL